MLGWDKDEYVCNGQGMHRRAFLSCCNFDLHAWDPKDSRRLEARAFWMAITHALRVRWRHAFGMTMRLLRRIHFLSGHDIMMVSRRVSREGASPQAMQGSYCQSRFWTAGHLGGRFWGSLRNRNLFVEGCTPHREWSNSCSSRYFWGWKNRDFITHRETLSGIPGKETSSPT